MGQTFYSGRGFRTPDKAQRDKNLFHCEFGTSEQQKQRCRLRCIPRTWQGSKQGHGGVFKRLLPPSYGGHLDNKNEGPPRGRDTSATHCRTPHLPWAQRGCTRHQGQRMQEEVRRCLLHWLQPMESPWKATRNILSDLWNAGQHHWLSLQKGTRSFTGVKCRAALWSFHFKLIFTVNFQFIGFDQIMVIIRLGDIHA